MTIVAQSFRERAMPGKKVGRDNYSNGFMIWDAGSVSVLNYRPKYGNRSNMLGGAFGIGFSHYWNEHFGFLLGAELALYQSKFNTKSFQDNYNTIDLDVYDEPEKINFRYRLDYYKETQRLCNINIPLMLQYRTLLWRDHYFYMGLGFKFGIPVVAKAKISYFDITSMGYYYSENQVLNDVTELGFGKFSKRSFKSKFDLGLSYIGALEAGVKWYMNEENELYFGLYFDYSFNDIAKNNHDKHIVEYASYDGSNFNVANSILVSQYKPIDNLHRDVLPENEQRRVTDRVSLMSIGVKLCFRIGFKKKDRFFI
jgi:hypothetical protein